MNFDIANLHIAIEANAGFGQDAAVYGENYAFVFDGLGGTGGKSCMHRDGRKWKEAKVASRAAAEAVGKTIDQRWNTWAQQIAGASDGQMAFVLDAVRAELKQSIDEAFQSAAREWNVVGGTLPTTVAGWITFPQQNGQTLAVSVWAGDSRCYTMDDHEMKLCTLDDVDEKYREDAMQELLGSGSAPMNNRAGINYEYHLNASCRSISCRTMLLCCTDGIYGGMTSPMHMEYYLRLLTDYETAGEMAEGWKSFFVDNGLLQDDAATLESIFVDAPDAQADEDARMQSMREMMAAAIDGIEKAYIDTFPEHITDETADVDGQIGSLARQMCTKRAFHNTLRKNAVEIVRKGKAFPDDLPCARVLRQMQEEQREAANEKRTQLRRQVGRAQLELDEYVDGLDTGESEMRKERVDLSPDAEMRLRQNRFYEFLQDVESRFGRAVRYMQDWYSYGMGYGARRPEGSFNMKAINDLDEVMKDVCIFVNDYFNLLPRMDGRPRMKTVRVGKAFIQRRRERLSSADQEDLKLSIRRMVESGETMDESLFENKSWSLSEVANVVMLTEKVIKAERELARFEKNPTADKEPSTAALDDYLKSHPNSDARYFIEDWVKQKKKPTYFSLSEKDLLAINRSVSTLLERAEENERIRNRHGERKQQIMNLWAQYKPGYEAWDEAVWAKDNSLKPTEEPVEESKEESIDVISAGEADVLTTAETNSAAESAELEQKDQPTEAAGEASGEQGEEAMQQEAAEEPAVEERESEEKISKETDSEEKTDEETAQQSEAAQASETADAEEEWTDCESVEIHE